MKQSRLIEIFTYLILIVCCGAVVLAVNKAAGTGLFSDKNAGVESSAAEENSGKEQQGFEKEETPPVPEKEVFANQDEEDETQAGSRRKRYTAREKEEEAETLPQAEEEKGPPRLILATDMHYMSSKLTDYGEAFEAFTAKDDGKTLRYSSELMDAFLEEVLEYKPDALILSGDLTVNGEKVNHQELAGKLDALQKEGIQILVIPGNHDINNPNAASYIGEKREAAQQVTPEEFYQIYHTFGYDQAASRDPYSLSYRYILDDKYWLLMLDSCQYEPYNKVGGKIKDETYVWIREQYALAEEAGAVMVPVAHHNLMGESRVYPTECAIEGGEELIAIMEQYQVPLYLSGHLHLQRIKKYQPEPGTPKDRPAVTEAVTGSLAIAPCRYGIIEWAEDGSLSYRLQTVNVSAWAERNRIEDENLRDFYRYSEDFVKKVVSDQTYKTLSALPEDMKKPMSDLYGQLNYEYCVGKATDEDEIRNSKGYRLWERNKPDSKELELIEKMIDDLKVDNLYWESGIPDESQENGGQG